MKKLLDVENLEIHFKTEKGYLRAVNGISFFLNEDEVLGVVGESGSGKSVSMMGMVGLLPKNMGHYISGKVIYNEKDLIKNSDKENSLIRGQEIAFIFQDPMSSLNPVLSVGSQITETIKRHKKLSKKECRERALELLELVGISNPSKRFDEFPHHYSGGMRQRALIAIGLSCEPKILIADEPTTALDVTIQAQIIDLVLALKEKVKMSVIWITHDLGVIAGISDRLQVMYAGKIVEQGITDSIFEQPKHPYTRALLGSIPTLDSKDGDELRPINGTPPDLILYPDGCPFYERCASRYSYCFDKNPPKLKVDNQAHTYSCFVR